MKGFDIRMFPWVNLVLVFVSVQVLEVLWELAHLPTLPTSLVQQALEEHLGILSDAYAVKELVKRSYIIKCIEDIKKVRQTKYSIFFVYLGSCWGLAFHWAGALKVLFILYTHKEKTGSICHES